MLGAGSPVSFEPLGQSSIPMDTKDDAKRKQADNERSELEQLEIKREALLLEMREIEAAKQRLMTGEANKSAKAHREEGKGMLSMKDDDVYNTLVARRRQRIPSEAERAKATSTLIVDDEDKFGATQLWNHHPLAQE
jgi:hypothetical protein